MEFISSEPLASIHVSLLQLRKPHWIAAADMPLRESATQHYLYQDSSSSKSGTQTRGGTLTALGPSSDWLPTNSELTAAHNAAAAAAQELHLVSL